MRVSPSPIDQLGGGHFRTVQQGAAVLAASGALLHEFLNPVVAVAAVLRVQVGFVVATAITAQRIDPVTMTKLSAFTAKSTTNATLLGVPSRMRTSNMSAANCVQQIESIAAGMTGAVATADAVPMGVYNFGGAFGALAANGPMQDIYRCNVDQGEYPLVLGVNEGFKTSWGATALISGSVIPIVAVEWVEFLNGTY